LKKNFSLFLGLRYLRPKRTSVSIITLISILGVTLGVAILVVVVAVMTGFEAKLKETILGFEPHISLVQAGGGVDPSDIEEDDPLFASRWDQVMEKMKAQPGVKAVFPYVSGNVLIEVGPEGDRRRIAPQMRAVWAEDEDQQKQLDDLFGDEKAPILDQDCIFLSTQLAEELGINELGSKVTLVASKNLEELLDAFEEIESDPNIKKEDRAEKIKGKVEELMLPIEVEVTGIFDSVWFSSIIVVPLSIGQEMYSLREDVHALSVQLEDPYMVDIEAKKLIEQLPPYWGLNTWISRNKGRFDAVRNERAMMSFVLFFIVIVAAFSIMNTMITVTVQKRKEIGVMKALGATEGQIIWVFLSQGMIVGLLGTATGIGMGALVTKYRNEIKAILSESFGVDIFPAAIYAIAEIPAKIVASDLLVISIGAFILCSLAAWVPAKIAARLDPAKALRDS